MLHRRRRLLVLAALTALTALAVSGCSGGGTDEPDRRTTPGLGACHVLTPADVAKPTNDTPRVACSKRHSSQTFAVGTFPRDVARSGWSGKGLGRWIYRTCGAAFTRFLGSDDSEVLRSRLSWAWFRPSKDGWDDGARWYRCDAVGGPDDATSYAALPRTLRNYLGAAPRDAWMRCAVGADVRGREVACSQPHQWRAVTTIKLGGPQDPYPGDHLASVRSQQYCSASVSAWLNYPATAYRYGITIFHRAEWQAGNRRSICWARTDR